jgi:uncharacterized protein
VTSGGRRGGGGKGPLAGTVLCLLVLSPGLEARQALSLPPIPEDFRFVQDYAGVLPAEARQQVGLIQQEAFGRYGVPIVVVTIPSKAHYGGHGREIEAFAAEWFRHWGITGRGPEGQARNNGILLLVSVQDRVARIELGADWGRTWDGYAQHVMDRTMVPRFRGGDYGAGVRDGARALLGMAASGPEAAPPGRLGRMVDSATGGVMGSTPLPGGFVLLLLVGGLAVVLLSFFVPEHRTTLLLIGFGMMAAALVFWFLLIALVALFGNRLEGGSGRGGFGSSGAFGGGGFSGGGGATGRW